ncbi:MAG: SulP family inorganic anion transporter [Kineosporiaceae bacterium]
MTSARPRWTAPSRGDVLAGTSVALVLVPQSLAYAQLAGAPPVHGLYTAIAAPLAAALFASSPYLQTGPVALTGLLTLAALQTQVPVGTESFAASAALLALVVGVARILLGVLRAGVIGYLLSAPAVAGFTTGAALLIVASQIPTLLGEPSTSSNPAVAAARALAHPDRWDLGALALALGVVALVRACRRLNPLVPGVLLATVGALTLVAVLGPIGAPVGRLDVRPPDFPPVLPWGQLPSLLLPGLVIAVVGFAEPAAIARRYATAERQRWSPDRELVAQGVANVAAGLASGLPSGGSFSRTALNRLAGATSRWSGALTGLAVLALLPLTAVLSTLPRAALAGLVIAPTVSLIDVHVLRRYWRLSPAQALVAGVTLLATLVLAPHLERAVLVGVGLALVVHLWRELHLPVQVELDGRTLRLRPYGVLYFASAPGLEDRLLALLLEHPQVDHVVIDLGGMGRIDLTGMLALRALIDDFSARVDVEVVNVSPTAARLVDRVLLTTARRHDRGRPTGQPREPRSTGR